MQEGARRHQNVATWVLADIGATVGQGVLAGVAEVCFYRSGVLSLDGAPGAQVLAATSATADPAGQPLAAAVQAGLGRVVVFADSDLFGDDSIEELDHRTLWTNVVTWAAGTATAQDALAATAVSAAADAVELDEHWLALKDAVDPLRPLQSKDGSIDAETHDLAAARRLVDDITARDRRPRAAVPARRRLPRGRAGRLPALGRRGLRHAGLPRLARALPARPAPRRRPGAPGRLPDVHPERQPRPQRRGAGHQRRLAAVAGRAGADATTTRCSCRSNFVDFTPGYDTNSAVLFPETVAVREVPKFHWGAIFCDREAARFRRISTAAAQTLGLQLPPDAERLVAPPGPGPGAPSRCGT